MRRIIIEYDQIVESPEMAVSRVLEVMKKGRISNANVQGYPCPHYCWSTRFADNARVEVRKKRTLISADSFFVWTPMSEVSP